jgi:glucokinase
MEYAVGIDIGGTSLRAARISEHGTILSHHAAPTPGDPLAVMTELDRLIELADGSAGNPLGIGIPARVDVRHGTAMPGGYVDLSGPPLAQRLKQAANRKVTVDNDGNMALIAEARIGAARGRHNAVMFTIGTGIGGALLSDGRILHGAASAGQLGHLTVMFDGLPCKCGRRGCVETTSSGTALRRHMAQAGLDLTTDVEALLRRDDTRARAVVTAWASPLRHAIDSIVAAVDPELVVLGGSLGRAACTALERFPPLSSWFNVPVVPAALGGDAGVIGAGLAALETST